MSIEFRPWLQVDVADATRDRIFSLFGWRDPPPSTEARLLDFGCGNGRYMTMFSKLLPRENVYGVDVDTSSFKDLSRAGFNCTPLSPSEAKIPFEDGYFNYIFSSNVIEHIPPHLYTTYIHELLRVLTPGGSLMLGAPNYPAKRIFDLRTAWKNRNDLQKRNYYLYDDPTHINRVSVSRVERDLQNVGFTDIRLLATELPFQNTFRALRQDGPRYIFRRFGNKFIGTCKKPRTDDIVD